MKVLSLSDICIDKKHQLGGNSGNQKGSMHVRCLRKSWRELVSVPL